MSWRPPENRVPPTVGAAAQRFVALAHAIAYRWTAERDTWLGRSELEAVRAFLSTVGVATRALPDGSFVLDDGSTRTVSGARLFVLALRRLVRGPLGPRVGTSDAVAFAPGRARCSSRASAMSIAERQLRL
jgi:hypothetical protein